MNGEPPILFDSFDRQRNSASYSFTGLTEAITARSPAEVVPALRRVEAAVARGFHAAGFISYEAAAGLDPVLVTPPAGPLPLLWFGIFATRTAIHTPKDNASDAGSYETGDWRCSVSAGELHPAPALSLCREAGGVLPGPVPLPTGLILCFSGHRPLPGTFRLA